MTKTTESVLFLFFPPMQACYSLSLAPTNCVSNINALKGPKDSLFGNSLT